LTSLKACFSSTNRSKTRRRDALAVVTRSASVASAESDILRRRRFRLGSSSKDDLWVGSDLVQEPTAEFGRGGGVVRRKNVELVEKGVQLCVIADPEKFLPARVVFELEGGVGVAEDQDAAGKFLVDAEDFHLLRLHPDGVDRHVRVEFDDTHRLLNTAEALEPVEGVGEFDGGRDAKGVDVLDGLDLQVKLDVNNFLPTTPYLLHRRRLSTAPWTDERRPSTSSSILGERTRRSGPRVPRARLSTESFLRRIHSPPSCVAFPAVPPAQVMSEPSPMAPTAMPPANW